MLRGVKTDPASNVTVLRQNHEQLVSIECECGSKILLLLDLKEMNCAVEAHVAEHKKLKKSSRKAEISACRIRQDLTEQVIVKAAGK